MKKLDEEIKDELGAGVYDDMCSDVCAWCGDSMPYDLDRYVTRGNQCQACAKITGHAIKRRVDVKAALSKNMADKLKDMCYKCGRKMTSGVCFDCDDNEISKFSAFVSSKMSKCKQLARKNIAKGTACGDIFDESNRLAELLLANNMYKSHKLRIDAEVVKIVTDEIINMQLNK